MARSTLSIALCLLSVAGDVAALKFSIKGRPTQTARSLGRRAPTTNDYGSSALNNTQDFSYYADVVLNGTTFEALIDTGSSDLWVAGRVPGAADTGITSGVTYAVGEVQGPVMQARLEFAGHTIANQAFLQITPDRENTEGTGLLGLGPNYGSNIFYAAGQRYGGVAVIDRIFAENTSTPNYITTYLGRSDDPTDTFQGEITISETVDGFESITSQPKLPVSLVSMSTSVQNQHWQTLLDEDGIEVDGKAISLPRSSVAGQSQLTAIMDTGFSIPQVPEAIAEAMYSGVKGAVYTNDTQIGPIWVLDCDSEINITFKFGGVSYPIHPLDAVLDAGVDGNGRQLCIGGFQPITTSNGGNFDMILGMAFLRNAYLLIDYGDFQVNSKETTDPYMQMLALTTDLAEAHSDFVKVRGGGGSTGSGSGSVSGSGNNPSSGNGASSLAISGLVATVATAFIFMLV